MNIDSIKEYIQKALKRLDKDKLKVLFTPYRDWGVLSAIFFTLFVFLIIINAYFFIHYNKEGAFVKTFDREDGMETLKVKELELTIGLFDKKENTFNKLLKYKPGIVDPSL